MKAWKGRTVELGHGRPVAAQLHRGRSWPPSYDVGRVRRGRVRRDPEDDARDGRAHREALRDHGQVRSRRRRSRSSSTSGARGTRRCPAPTRASSSQQNSLRDALLAALNINIFARHADRVRMANIAQMINVLQAMILTDKEKMVLTPTYHVFKMYVPFQDATFVPVTFDAGTLHARRHHAAARRRHRREGRRRARCGWRSRTSIRTRPAEIAATPRRHRRQDRRPARRSRRRRSTASTRSTRRTTVAPKPVSAKVQGGTLSLTLEPKSVTVAVGASHDARRRRRIRRHAALAADGRGRWRRALAAAQVQTDVPAAGRRRQAGHRRAHQDPRRRARRQSRGQRRRSRRARLPAAELRHRQVAALSRRVRAARLLHRRRAVDAGDPRAADDRGRVRAGRAAR